MIIEKPESNIFGSKITTENFSIKSSPKAFQILSSNLYSNKIRAVIREYSCNALDAHKYAGVEDKPFFVQLPSILEQNFIVRDFGNGLSPKEITELFTTYFGSSKDQSNDYIGALGLGSKSAFSYTDAFSCTSIFEGIKYVYSLFLDSGEPKVTLLFQEETDEHSGVEINIPVKSEDIHNFEKEAEFVYSTFDIKPTGIEKLGDIPKLDINKYISFVEVNKNIHYLHNSKPIYARMGNVLYELDLNQIPGYHSHLVSKILYYFGYKLINRLFFINFEIGELDIAPSREQLSYDKNTINTIKNRLDEIDFENLINNYLLDKKEYIESSKNWIDCNKKILEIFYNTPSNILNDQIIRKFLEDNNIMINGRTLSDFLNLHKNYFTSEFYEDPNSFKIFTNVFYQKKDSYTMSVKKYNSNSFGIRSSIVEHLALLFDDYLVILKDEDESWGGCKSYFKTWFNNNYSDRDFIIYESSSNILKDIKKFIEDQYSNTDILIYNYSDLVDEIQKEKNKFILKPIKNRNKKPLDCLYTKFSDFNTTKTNSEIVNLYSKQDFRRYIKNNPDAKFIHIDFYNGDRYIVNCNNEFYSIKTSVLKHILHEDFEKEVLPKLVFVNEFRWNDLIKENNLLFDISKEKKCIDINEDILIDVLYSLGYVGVSRAVYTMDIFKNEFTDVHNKLREIVLDFFWCCQKTVYDNKFRSKEDFCNNLRRSGDYYDLGGFRRKIKLICGLFGFNHNNITIKSEVKLINNLIKTNKTFSDIYELCGKDRNDFLSMIDTFYVKNTLMKTLFNS